MSEATGYGRFFPYADTYPNQREAMETVAGALSRGRDVLFEGAPGTGKTLAALAPALAHAREHDRTVVITTNVHQQMRQFVADARAITREEPIRAVVFRGKASMCHIDVGYEECQALRDATRSLVEKRSDREELSREADRLLDELREGSEGAAEARDAVTEELDRLDEEIEDIEAGNVCEHYRNNLLTDGAAFEEWLFDDVRTPEEVYEYADERELCGYELLKEGLDGIDLVVCNYHHLLDPAIREQFFRWLGRDPEEVITVFDEAHNVESAAREHATETLTETTIERALEELAGADDARADNAHNLLTAFLRGLREAYDGALGFGEREQVGEDWHDLSVANDDRRDDLTLAFLEAYGGPGIGTEADAALRLGKDLDEEYERAFRRGETTTRRECPTLQAAAFVESWLDGGTDQGRHPMVAVRRDAGTGEVYGRAELYTCIPRAITEPLFGATHANVLMSATLRPFDVFADVLGLDAPETLAYGLAYPEENRRTYAVGTPALFASERDDPAVQSAVGDALADAIEMTPGNVLAFFPSYAEAERYHGRLAGDGSDWTGYLDEPGVRAEELRRAFVDDGNGALFTSLWGTLGEGVSFDGDDARAVVVVGVPYPRLSDRLAAVRAAYDREFAAKSENPGWRYAVEIPTIRKTRQALGRVIRSPADFGVRVLLDRRYTGGARAMGKYGVRGSFPPEERAELVDVEPEKLAFAVLNFFEDRDAYDGEPPQP